MTHQGDELPGQFQALCEDGDALSDAGSYPAALECYRAAWALLPEPRTQWEASTWLLAAIGDNEFLEGDFAAGRDTLALAMCCPDAPGNPFLHLRLGQCCLELGETDRAAVELGRAYLGAGAELFQNEHPKYLAFLKTRQTPPPGGW